MVLPSGLSEHLPCLALKQSYWLCVYDPQSVVSSVNLVTKRARRVCCTGPLDMTNLEGASLQRGLVNLRPTTSPNGTASDTICMVKCYIRCDRARPKC
jgi:hypothetical protein